MLLGTTHTGKALIHRILRGRPFPPPHTGSLLEAGLSYAATYTAVLVRFTFQAGPTYDRNIHDRPSLQTPYCQGPSYQVAHAVALMRDPPLAGPLHTEECSLPTHGSTLPPPSSSPSPNRGLG